MIASMRKRLFPVAFFTIILLIVAYGLVADFAQYYVGGLLYSAGAVFNQYDKDSGAVR